MFSVPCRFVEEDFKKLQDVLRETISIADSDADVSSLRRVYNAMDIIIKRKAFNHARRYICIDDCDMIPKGHNGNLYDLPLHSLRQYIPTSSYLGKAIIEWRLRIQK